jgi:hypothetical protein
VVANGKVYLATFSNSLIVYGLLGDQPHHPLGPWQQASVGTGVLGSASESCERYTILGGGRDIWDTADAFHFIYQSVTAGGTITLTARVLGVQDTDPWAKAGLMFRASLDVDAPNALVALTPGNGVTFQERRSKGAASFASFTTGLGAPRWLRLIADPVPGQPGQFRFSASHSTDGVTWTAVGTVVEFALGANAPLVGLAVCSHTVTSADPIDVGLEELNLSTFDHVSVS